MSWPAGWLDPMRPSCASILQLHIWRSTKWMELRDEAEIYWGVVFGDRFLEMAGRIWLHKECNATPSMNQVGSGCQLLGSEAFCPWPSSSFSRVFTPAKRIHFSYSGSRSAPPRVQPCGSLPLLPNEEPRRLATEGGISAYNELKYRFIVSYSRWRSRRRRVNRRTGVG